MSEPPRTDVPGIDLPPLAELGMPAPVSALPETLAWKVLLAAVLLGALAAVLLACRRHARRRWRREAAALAGAARAARSADAWFAAIKRVCLVHLSRPQLAALDDAAVLARLPRLDADAREALLGAHHRRDAALADGPNDALARAFAHWLQDLPDAR